MRKTQWARVLFSLSLCSFPAWAQIGLVHVTQCGPQNFPGAGCSIPATASGSLIVVGWQLGGNANTSTTILGISDNAGNVYSEAGAAQSVDAPAGSATDIWYAKNSVPGATSLVITPSAPVVNGGVIIWEFSGVSLTAPLDQTAVLSNQGLTVNPSGAAVTTTAPGVIISLSVVSGNITGMNSGSPFTNDSALKENGWAHSITTNAGTYSAQWITDGPGTYASSTASFKAATSTSLCDLNQDGVVNNADVALAINMALGAVPCTANIGGAGICDVVVVQRVVVAALGGACVTGGTVPHYVSLNWSPSTSSNVVGYNVYRAALSGGQYTRVNGSPVVGTSYTDSTVTAGKTYYYVCSAVDSNGNQSIYSPEAVAAVPVP